ncbi:DNA polymerase III subunit delta [Niveibacterium sp. SC-1]|uniref:DNA polymerase III subunit delta n=1 Tax=Niveibacterium sp. SC-1 TaxID=3135646 RepID=UPI00311D693B
MRPEQLTQALTRGLAPLYVVHGDEPLLVLEASDAIRAAARAQGIDEREVLVVTQGFKWLNLEMAAGNLSLFGDRKLIDLRIPTGKPGRDGGDALQRYAKNLDPQGVVTLVTLPQLDWAARKAAWFVALCEAGEEVECNAPPLAQLPEWLGQRLARQQQRAPREALEFIAQHVEGNLLAAHQEMQKLALLFEPGELTLEQVQDAVLNVARYDTEKLRGALLEGDPARLTRLIEGLQGEGAAPPLVLWAMASEIRTLALVRAGMDEGQPVAALMKRERVFDRERQSLLQRAVQRVSTPQMRAALMHAAKLDRMVKGLAHGDVWDEFLQLALRLAARPRRAAR